MIKRGIPKILVLLALAFGLGVVVLSSPAYSECRMTVQAKLPVTFWGFVPTVTARINGRDVTMGVDTGAQGTVVTPEAAKALQLPEDPTHHTQIIGATATTRVNNRILTSLEVGSAQWKGMSVGVVSIPLSSPSGQMLAGMLGADVLANYDLEYSPPDRTLSLYHVAGCSPVRPAWHGDYAIVLTSITSSHRMALPVELDGHALLAIFDTGSSGLRLAHASLPKVNVGEDDLAKDPTFEAGGVGNPNSHAHLHHFRKIQIGREIFPGPNIQVVDFPASEADMLLGEDYMHARRFWLSYSTHALFIQRASQH